MKPCESGRRTTQIIVCSPRNGVRVESVGPNSREPGFPMGCGRRHCLLPLAMSAATQTAARMSCSAGKPKPAGKAWAVEQP